MTTTIPPTPRPVGHLRRDAGEVTLPVILGVALVLVVLVVLAIRVGYATGVLEDEERPRVLVLGDSITDRGQRALRDEVAASFDLSIDGKASFRTDMLVPAAERWATRSFQQVVVNLGTNDIAAGTPADESIASLTEIVGLYPDAACIHLVTVNEEMPPELGPDVQAGARALNERIRALAATDDRLHVVDWAAVVHEQRAAGREITLDGVHPDDDGNELLAEIEGASLLSCDVRGDG